MDADTRAELERALFRDTEGFAYAIADGAQIQDLPGLLLRMGTIHHCLFVGELEPEVRAVAPHLISLNEDTGIFEHLLDNGWGKHWAIYLRSPHEPLNLRKHLRTLSLAEMPDGEVVFFRYYDPRSLRSLVPLMEPEQKTAFFGKDMVESFFCEDEDPAMLVRLPAP